MRFREWLQNVVLSDFINEAVVFKGNVTRNATAVLQHLDAHLRKHSNGGMISNKTIVDTIRHQYTTYDDEWRALDHKRIAKMDLCEYIEQHNQLVRSTAELVKSFIEKYLAPAQAPQLIPFNIAWLKSKLIEVPANCHDEDPRQWRSGFKKVPVRPAVSAPQPIANAAPSS